jgi:hypothetical protein
MGVSQTTKFVIAAESQTGAAPATASLQDILNGTTNIPIEGALTGTFNGSVGATTPGTGAFTIITGSVANNLTAGTTHTLAGATPLTAQINVLATVANASDAAALPSANAAMVGSAVVVFNNGAHAAAIWPQAADAIDGGSAGAAVTLTNAKRCIYYCIAANTWISAQLGVTSA